MVNRKPGARWRIRATTEADPPIEVGSVGEFDELCVDDWLHIERLDDRVWWMAIGDARVVATVHAVGPVEVTVERGEFGPVHGATGMDKARPVSGAAIVAQAVVEGLAGIWAAVGEAAEGVGSAVAGRLGR